MSDERMDGRTSEATRREVAVELSAVIVASSGEEPIVLAVRSGSPPRAGLPSGPLEIPHRTLETGLRAWVERQTSLPLGYVEQLYTFGDRDRSDPDGRRVLSIGYLALAREARPAGSGDAAWHAWYRHFPWEDWRQGRPAALVEIDRRLGDWVAAAPSDSERRRRAARVQTSFGHDGEWNEERVLERYELLYGTGLVPEAHQDGLAAWASPDMVVPGEPMIADHRRILATAIARLRGKIKYRPLVFELMPPAFTFLQLQRAVEGLAGLRLHKPNFRRLVEQQGLVEETGELEAQTGGRPARLLRFRRGVLLERPAPGMRLPLSRRTA